MPFGLGLDKIFYVTPKANPRIKSATIDLTEWVLESSSTGTSSLEIQCLSCKTETQDDRRIQTSSPLSLSINADLLALRNDVLVERKRIEDALLAEKVRLGILESERLERDLAEKKRIESEQRAELARRKQSFCFLQELHTIG